MGGSVRGCLASLVIVWALAANTSPAQSSSFDRNMIFIDPAHGGADTGGRIGDQLSEKDVTLALAERLRSLLAARNFTVTMARSGDEDGGSPDQRAEVANRTHAVACIVLHASANSNGVVLGTSALGTALMRRASGEADKPGTGVSWSRAQEAYAAQSGRLANQLGTALTRSSIPVTIMRVVLRPLDNLTCAAISMELGPYGEPGTRPTQASDDVYQQRVAELVADVLAQWRSDARPPADPTATTASTRGATP